MRQAIIGLHRSIFQADVAIRTLPESGGMPLPWLALR